MNKLIIFLGMAHIVSTKDTLVNTEAINGGDSWISTNFRYIPKIFPLFDHNTFIKKKLEKIPAILKSIRDGPEHEVSSTVSPTGTVDTTPTPSMFSICHKPETHAEKTLYVPASALKGHLGHGDSLGRCKSGDKKSEDKKSEDKKSEDKSGDKKSEDKSGGKH